jgi:ankyrin repeat protein
MLSVYSGHTQLSTELLARGADPNRLNDRGQSILAGAVFKGHDAIIPLLVEKGADPRLGEQPNAIQAAHMFGRRDLFEILGARDEDIGVDVPTPPSAA